MAVNCYLVFIPEDDLYYLRMTLGWPGIEGLKFSKNCKIIVSTRVKSPVKMAEKFDEINVGFKVDDGFYFQNEDVAELQFKKCIPGMISYDTIGPDGDGWRTLSNYTTDFVTLSSAARSLDMNPVRYKALASRGAIVVDGNVYQPISDAVRKSTGRPSKFGFRDMSIGEVKKFETFLEFRNARNAANSLMGRTSIILDCNSKALTIERIE